MQLNKELLEKYKMDHSIIEVKCVGKSMEPQLKDSSIVYVMCCRSREVAEGDIITFYYNNSVACHRCIICKDSLIYEKGDNCALFNRLNMITDEEVIGKVVAYKNFSDEICYVENYILYAQVLRVIGKISHRFAYKVSKNDCALAESGPFSRLIGCIIMKVFKASVRRSKR